MAVDGAPDEATATRLAILQRILDWHVLETARLGGRVLLEASRWDHLGGVAVQELGGADLKVGLIGWLVQTVLRGVEDWMSSNRPILCLHRDARLVSELASHAIEARYTAVSLVNRHIALAEGAQIRAFRVDGRAEVLNGFGSSVS